MDFKKSFCCNDDVIHVLSYVNMKCCVLWPPPGLKTSMENDKFWSEIGSGFGKPGGTPPPRIPMSTPPGPILIWDKNWLFHQSLISGCYNRDEPQRGRNSCLWLQSRSVLSSFGVVLMSCRVNFHVVRSALQYSMVFCLQNLIFLFPGAHQIWWAPVISQPCLRRDAFILSTLIHFILHKKLTNFSN